MAVPSLKELLEAGVHFGHETRRWNPKMAGNIFTAKEKIHIIDLEKTEKALSEAIDFVKEIGQAGGQIIFLGTKKQASEIVKTEAERVGAMYLTTRWVGGLFTNYESVQKNIAKLSDLEEKVKDDSFTKKEQLLMSREIQKLLRNIGGVRTMTKLPEAIFIVDSKKEANAVAEARKMDVKIIAIVDTNGDPTVINYPIPGNDDAIRAISIMVKTIADAYEDGKEIAGKKAAKEAKTEEPEGEIVEVIEKPAAKKETKKETKSEEEKPKKTVKKATKAKKETK